VHLPLPASDAAAAFESETWRMFHQTDHRTPMLNGYSGYFPAIYDSFEKLLNEEFPSYRSLCALHEAAGINTVIVDRRPEASPRLFDDPEVRRLLTPAYRDDDVLIFRLAPSAADCIVQP
jgi:hypothetical protein